MLAKVIIPTVQTCQQSSHLRSASYRLSVNENPRPYTRNSPALSVMSIVDRRALDYEPRRSLCSLSQSLAGRASTLSRGVQQGHSESLARRHDEDRGEGQFLVSDLPNLPPGLGPVRASQFQDCLERVACSAGYAVLRRSGQATRDPFLAI